MNGNGIVGEVAVYKTGSRTVVKDSRLRRAGLLEARRLRDMEAAVIRVGEDGGEDVELGALFIWLRSGETPKARCFQGKASAVIGLILSEEVTDRIQS